MPVNAASVTILGTNRGKITDLNYGISYVYNETDNSGIRTWAYSSKTMLAFR